MIEEILKGLYRIEIPLPHSPLKYLNSYVFKDGERHLIVDTGFNRPECREALMDGLKKLSVDLEKSDIYLTHLHADHSGQCGIAAPGAKVYVSRKDAIGLGGFKAEKVNAIEIFRSTGFPEEELARAVSDHPALLYSAKHLPPLTFVQDGDIINVGDYSLRCIETPGHSPQHTCLYDAAKKLFLAGDHILIDITPNISSWRLVPDPLNSYLESLEKIYPLDIELILPGHRRLFHDHRARIDELKAHHQKRAAEVLNALKKGPQNLYQIAPQITWDIRCDNWESFPPQQKWFACSETMSHVVYLENQGKVRRITNNGSLIFALV